MSSAIMMMICGLRCDWPAHASTRCNRSTPATKGCIVSIWYHFLLLELLCHQLISLQLIIYAINKNTHKHNNFQHGNNRHTIYRPYTVIMSLLWSWTIIVNRFAVLFISRIRSVYWSVYLLNSGLFWKLPTQHKYENGRSSYDLRSCFTTSRYKKVVGRTVVKK